MFRLCRGRKRRAADRYSALPKYTPAAVEPAESVMKRLDEVVTALDRMVNSIVPLVPPAPEAPNSREIPSAVHTDSRRTPPK